MLPLDFLQLAGYCLGFQGVLGEERPALLLPFGGVVPFLVELRCLGDHEVLEQHLLAGIAAAEQQAFEQGLHDRVRIRRHRHRDPQAAADGLMLAEQHVQHRCRRSGCRCRKS